MSRHAGTEWMVKKVAEARQGDTEAFGDLVSEFQSSLRGFIARLGVPADSVEDVAQDTFVAAYKSIQACKDEKTFDKWLRGVARNMVRRFHSARARDEELKRRRVADLLVTREPDEAVTRSEDAFRDFLLECVKKLPKKSAELIRRKYYEGMKSAQIAAGIDRSAAGVRVALGRVLVGLKNCVDRMAEES